MVSNPRIYIIAVFILLDLYNEVFEIIDSCTFAAKSISPTMWQAFELIHRTFKAGAELYLEGEYYFKRFYLTPLISGRYVACFGEFCQLRIRNSYPEPPIP